MNKERYRETVDLYSAKKTITEKGSNFINYAFKNKVPIEDIFFVNQDDAKNIFLITNEANNIIKMDDKNTILLNIKEGILTMFFRLFYEKRRKNNFYNN